MWCCHAPKRSWARLERRRVRAAWASLAHRHRQGRELPAEKEPWERAAVPLLWISLQRHFLSSWGGCELTATGTGRNLKEGDKVSLQWLVISLAHSISSSYKMRSLSKEWCRFSQLLSSTSDFFRNFFYQFFWSFYFFLLKSPEGTASVFDQPGFFSYMFSFSCIFRLICDTIYSF